MEKSETEEIKKDLEENVVPELHDLHPEIFEKVLEWATRKVATERRKAVEGFVEWEDDDNTPNVNKARVLGYLEHTDKKVYKKSQRSEQAFHNSSGDILVKLSAGQAGACGIVEALHLWSENKSGCVIFAWKRRMADGSPIAEVYSIHGRMVDTVYDSPDVLLDALKFGQQLAESYLKQQEGKQ